jgi:hypothetical protein
MDIMSANENFQLFMGNALSLYGSVVRVFTQRRTNVEVK